MCLNVNESLPFEGAVILKKSWSELLLKEPVIELPADMLLAAEYELLDSVSDTVAAKAEKENKDAAITAINRIDIIFFICYCLLLI